MFEFNPHLQYLMPAHFGIPHTERTSLAYNDVTTLSIAYQTEAALLERLLPEPFRLLEPVVFVYYAANHEVDWLAGAAYNLLGVDVPVRFEGEHDQVDGSFCLVLWENDTDAILSGRELLGIPKIYADIEDHSVIGGRWSTTASHRSAPIVELYVDDLEEVPETELREMHDANAAANWLGWRYVPKIGEPGPALSHATCVPSGGSPEKAWRGRGEILWHRTSWERNPTQWNIVNTLADLPILEYRLAQVTRGGSTLADARKKPLRALR